MKVVNLIFFGIFCTGLATINHQEAFLQANLLFHAGKYQDALYVYQMLPESWAVSYNKAHCFYQMHEYVAALTYWCKAYMNGGVLQRDAILKNCFSVGQYLNISCDQLFLFNNVDYFLLKKSLFFWQMIFLLVFLGLCALLRTLIKKRKYAVLVGMITTLLFIGVSLGRYYYLKTRSLALVAENVEMTAGTSLHFNKVGMLTKGQLVFVTDQKEDWILVKSNGVIGWIPSSFVSYI